MSLTPAVAKKNHVFDPNAFLATIGEGRKNLAVSKKQAIFAQGDVADAVFYIKKSNVRLIVVSKVGKEATIGVGSGNFYLGNFEGGLQVHSSPLNVVLHNWVSGSEYDAHLVDPPGQSRTE